MKEKISYTTFLILVPSILTLLYLLPENLRENLVLYPKNPTLVSLFFSNYVHENFYHLLGNLISYIFTIILLLILNNNRKRFYIEIIPIFLILPWINSLAIVLLLRDVLHRSLGFSAINSGLIGYLLYSTCRHIKDKYNIDLGTNFILGVYIFTLATGTLICAIGYNLKYAIIAILFLPFSLWLFYLERNNLKDVLDRLKLEVKTKQTVNIFHAYIVMLSLLFAFATALVLIPPNLTVNGSVINIVSHWIGYGFGVLEPMILEIGNTRTHF